MAGTRHQDRTDRHVDADLSISAGEPIEAALSFEMIDVPPIRMWRWDTSLCFNRQNARYGTFSNMAEHFPIVLDGERYVSVEHLYQASQFPDHPERRALALAEPTPLRAKRRARRAQERETRSDWDVSSRRSWNLACD
jgi:hypothetical protein